MVRNFIGFDFYIELFWEADISGSGARRYSRIYAVTQVKTQVTLVNLLDLISARRLKINSSNRSLFLFIIFSNFVTMVFQISGVLRKEIFYHLVTYLNF